MNTEIKRPIVKRHHAFGQIITVLLIATLLLEIGISACAAAQEDALESAAVLSGLVVVLYREDRYSEAIPLAERVLAVRQSMLESHHPDVVHARNNLAVMYFMIADYPKAEQLYQQVLKTNEEA